jgi:predicted RNase H-like nuclease (RuvC/YqgF family)
MLSDLIAHAGSSALGGLFVAVTMWLKARAKSEESAGEAVKVKATSDAAVTTHLLATVEQLKSENIEFRQRHEECERSSADCERRYRELRADVDALRLRSEPSLPAVRV